MKKQVLRKSVILLIFSFSSFSSQLPPKFIQLLETIKNIDQNLKDTESQVFAAKSQRKALRGRLLPQVSFSAYTNNKERSTSFDDLLNSKLTGDISQTIYSAKTINSYRQGKANVKLVEAAFKDNQSAVFLDFITSYINFLKFSKLVEMAKVNVSNFEKHYRATNNRFRGGEATKTDVYKSQERLLNARSELQEFILEKNKRQIEVLELTGTEVKENEDLPDIKNFEDKISQDVKNSDPVSNNTLVQQTKKELEVSELQYKVDKAEHYPELSFRYEFEKEYSHEDDIGSNWTASIGIRLDIPIFTGGNTHYTKRSSYHNFLATRYRLAEQVKKTKRSLDISLQNLKSNKLIYDISLESKKLSKISLRGIEREYLNGSKTSLDVLESKEDLNTIEKKLIITKHDLVIEKYKIIEFLGKLNIDSIKRYLN